MSTFRIATRARKTTTAAITMPILAPLPSVFHAFVIPLVAAVLEADAVFAPAVAVAAAVCDVTVLRVVDAGPEWVAVEVVDCEVVALEDVTECVADVAFVLVDVADGLALATLVDAFAKGLELEIPN